MNANTILGGIAVVTSLVAVAGLVGWALVEGFKALRTRRGRGWHDQHGATTVEYALMMAVVVVAVAASLVSLQASVGEGGARPD